MLREFERRDWIRKRHEGIELTDPAAMLERWDEGYADTLRTKLLLKVCRRKPDTALEKLPRVIEEAGLDDRVFLGGELAAAALTRHLRPAKATLHLNDIDAAEAMRRLELLPDRAGDVVLMQTFGQAN